MQQQHKEILIERLLEKSIETIKAAEDNMRLNYLETALNRIYYAIFYIVTALSYRHDYITSKHSNLKGWFHKKFIYEDKIFSNELFEIYKKSFEYREKSDYDAAFEPDIETVQNLLADAKVFIEAVRKVI